MGMTFDSDDSATYDPIDDDGPREVKIVRISLPWGDVIALTLQAMFASAFVAGAVAAVFAIFDLFARR